jgi:uncharacterized protein YndB with AHSA1/START domain
VARSPIAAAAADQSAAPNSSPDSTSHDHPTPASGTITAGEPPHRLVLTWEFGKTEPSLASLDLTPVGATRPNSSCGKPFPTTTNGRSTSRRRRRGM